jgi:beta-phosphoglucomutase
MFRGAVFDLDGVIVDSHPIHKRTWRAFLTSLGKEVSESELDFILEGRGRREILIHFLGQLSDSEVRDYGDQKDKFFRQFSSALEPVPGILEFINELAQAGLCLSVATSASRNRTRWTLEQLRIAQYFKVVVTGDDVAESKPNAAVYRLAIQLLGIPAESVFAVEDSVCGVRSAKTAGLRCIGIGSGSNILALTSAGADRVFPNLLGRSITDLVELLCLRTNAPFQSPTKALRSTDTTLDSDMR